MNTKILTITVPAYNAEKYLDRCLQSFLVPEILDALEVLVINDGSRDSTSDIASRYVNQYPDTFHLINKKNGGHGSGINCGIAHATGKYFKIVDADDWLNTEVLAQYIGLLRTVDTDIVASDFVCVQDGSFRVMRTLKAVSEDSQYGHIYRISHGEVEKVIMMHSLTVRTECLKKITVPIDEHCFYVDMEYVMYPIPYADTVYYDHHVLYMYLLGRTGQSMDVKKKIENIDQHLHVLHSMEKYYSAGYTSDPNKKKYMARCAAIIVEDHFQIYISEGYKSEAIKGLRKFDQKLKADYPDIYAATQKKSISLLRKTNYWILPVGALALKIVKG